MFRSIVILYVNYFRAIFFLTNRWGCFGFVPRENVVDDDDDNCPLLIRITAKYRARVTYEFTGENASYVGEGGWMMEIMCV